MGTSAKAMPNSFKRQYPVGEMWKYKKLRRAARKREQANFEAKNFNSIYKRGS